MRTTRVLYLAPPGHTAAQLSRYSFLEEEIRSLANAGIDAFVMSTKATEDSDVGRVHVRAVPRRWEWGRTAAFAARHASRVPLPNVRKLRECLRAIHIERTASEVIHREGISLIHSYFAWPRGFGGALATAATGVPLVAGLRGSDVNTNSDIGYGGRLDPSFDRAVRRLLRATDSMIYVSEFMKRQAEALGAGPETGRVIRKGVRLDVFHPRPDRDRIRSELGWGLRPVILAVAGLVPIKGLDAVLEALAEVRASGHDMSFVVCGDGPERETLEATSRRLNLDGCVNFQGKISRDEIPRYFAAADVFVHGALIEASGNVLLEAMASGLPVVCTDAGGPAEYVLDGVTGFVVPVGDTRLMAARIVQLLEDTELRNALGRQGRARAEADFGYDRMIRETLKTYDRVLTAAGSAVRVHAAVQPRTEES